MCFLHIPQRLGSLQMHLQTQSLLWLLGGCMKGLQERQSWVFIIDSWQSHQMTEEINMSSRNLSLLSLLPISCLWEVQSKKSVTWNRSRIFHTEIISQRTPSVNVASTDLILSPCHGVSGCVEHTVFWYLIWIDQICLGRPFSSRYSQMKSVFPYAWISYAHYESSFLS